METAATTWVFRGETGRFRRGRRVQTNSASIVSPPLVVSVDKTVGQNVARTLPVGNRSKSPYMGMLPDGYAANA